MKLQQYLTEAKSEEISEDKIIELIRKNCKPFLTEFNRLTPSLAIYRGARKGAPYRKFWPRIDRMPSDMHPDNSKRANRLGKEHFGWKWRTEGVFTTNDIFTAESYGVTHFFFPIGKYKYVYHPDIADSLSLFPGDARVLDPKSPKYSEEKVKYIEDKFKGYKSSGLSSQLNTKVMEIVWK